MKLKKLLPIRAIQAVLEPKMRRLDAKNALKIAYLGAIIPYATAHAVPQYSVTDLGSFGGTYSIGLSVNNSGIASGFAHLIDNTSEHALVGDGLTQAQDLIGLGGKYSQAYSINNIGQVVGSSSLLGDASFHAFKWNGGATPPLVTLNDLKALTANPANINSRAFDINDAGNAVGFSGTNTANEHAVLWQPSGVIQDLGTLDGTGDSQATAINNSGLITGFSSLTGNKGTHAVLWNGKTAIDLGTLGGTHSAAYDINVYGEIIGSASTALDTAQHAVLWQSNAIGTLQDLGTLGGTFSEARGISNTGDIVGYSFTTNNAAQKAFIWQSDLGLQDLNSLIDPASGWSLLEATSISEDGNYIVGIGLVAVNGVPGTDRHAFLLKNIAPDRTPPVVTYSLTPALPSATGWYLSAPSLAWRVTDGQSAVTSKVGCVDIPVISDTTNAGISFSCSATSLGGTSKIISTPLLKVDANPPNFANVPSALSATSTSAAGASVTYPLPIATDTGSGVSNAGVSCLPASGSTFSVGATTVTCSASDNVGNIAKANFVVTVSHPTPPAAPLLSTTNVTTTGFKVNWTTVPGAGSYLLNINGVDNVLTTNTFTVSGLSAGSNYPISIKSCTYIEGVNCTTVASTLPLAQPQWTLPDTPSAPIISAVTDTGVTLSWTGKAPIYSIRRATNVAYTTGLVALTGAIKPNRAITGLTPNTNYYFRIISSTPAGSSLASDISNVLTALAVPGTVIGLTGSADSLVTAGLSWTASSGATAYEVMYGTVAQLSTNTGTIVTASANTQIPLTGIVAGSNVSLKVRAIKSTAPTNASAWSTVKTVLAQ